jgi:hypothetical protein
MSLYLPSGIQSGCIIWIMSKYYINVCECNSSRREEEFLRESFLYTETG